MKFETRQYPLVVPCGDAEVTLDLMTAGDADDLRAFIAEMPEHDLLFLDRDITHPKVVQAWVDQLNAERVVSLCARAGRAFVGCTALIRSRLSWSRHVGDLRVLVSENMRGQGLGRVLTQECFAQALELGLEKLTVQMTVDQKAAIASFEALGFRAEAVLANQVKDRAGNLHDLAILSHDVAAVQSRMHAFGIAESLEG